MEAVASCLLFLVLDYHSVGVDGGCRDQDRTEWYHGVVEVEYCTVYDQTQIRTRLRPIGTLQIVLQIAWLQSSVSASDGRTAPASVGVCAFCP